MLQQINNLSEHFEPYILKCRPGDWEHAKRVVLWIKKLAGRRNDLDLLVIAGFIHDIGWTGLVPPGFKLSREDLLKLQPQADKQTEMLVKDAVSDFNLSEVDLRTIQRLIKATETYEATQEDEMILVDADNLSKTSPEHVKQKYVKSDWLKMFNLFEEKLPQRIKTTQGKKLLHTKLVQLRKSLEFDLGSN